MIKVSWLLAGEDFAISPKIFYFCYISATGETLYLKQKVIKRNPSGAGGNDRIQIVSIAVRSGYHDFYNWKQSLS